MAIVRKQTCSILLKAILTILIVLISPAIYFITFDKADRHLAAVQIDEHLVNPESNEMTVALYDDLRALYGQKIISGQQIWSYPEAPAGYEDGVILQMTGKLPALNGFDLLPYTAYGDSIQIKSAITWHQDRGGIVAFCWHWLIPDRTGQLTYEAEKTDFDLEKGLIPGTEENDRLMRDLAKAADGLDLLKKADVPVLWRPLHEANLNYFWWSSQGPDTYRQLWDLMFTYFVQERDLDNLIWIWNGQDRGWSVPAEQFDIASMDIYPRSSIDRSSQVRLFRKCQTLAPTKMVALSECEFIPDPDLLIRDQANWLWYMTWHTNYLYVSDGDQGRPLPDESLSLNEAYINQADLTRIMDHDYVLTLDELPDEIKSGDEMPDEVKPSAD